MSYAQAINWIPEKGVDCLPHIDFEGVWVVVLKDVIDDKYIYNVNRLVPNGCSTYQVTINKDFDS